MLIYFYLMATSELVMFRNDYMELRDWGLFAWTFMLLFAQAAQPS